MKHVQLFIEHCAGFIVATTSSFKQNTLKTPEQQQQHISDLMRKSQSRKDE